MLVHSYRQGRYDSCMIIISDWYREISYVHVCLRVSSTNRLLPIKVRYVTILGSIWTLFWKNGKSSSDYNSAAGRAVECEIQNWSWWPNGPPLATAQVKRSWDTFTWHLISFLFQLWFRPGEPTPSRLPLTSIRYASSIRIQETLIHE